MATPINLPTVRANPLDPPPQLDELRERAPISRLSYPDGHVGWLVTSYDLARTILGDKRLTITRSMDRMPVDNRTRLEAFARLAKDGNRRVASGYAGNFLNMDPPEHTRFRRLVAGEFTPRRISELRPKIDAIVQEQLDAIADSHPPVDLVPTYAQPIPSLTICEILGVPNEARGHFQAWSSILDNPTTVPDVLADAYHEFTEFMYGLVENAGSLPHDSLISRLASHGELDEDELVGLAVLLVAAGHETVASQIGFNVYALLRERPRWDEIRDQPELIPGAVEELLRYLTIFQLGAMTRTATDDIEMGGVTIEAGESITISLAAANRDAERFADAGHMNLNRKASGHLAFGHGIHVCLGQHLARVELEASLNGLVGRFPHLKLTQTPDKVPMNPGYSRQAGPERLEVTW